MIGYQSRFQSRSLIPSIFHQPLPSIFSISFFNPINLFNPISLPESTIYIKFAAKLKFGKMIQRIQSLYLLLALAAVGTLFFIPIAELLINKEYTFIFKHSGLFEVQGKKEILSVSSLPLMSLFIINMFLSFVTIFLYKNRLLQLRVCVINMILLLGSLGIIYYYIAVAFSDFEAIVSYSISAIMPLIAAILTWLAFRAIKKDEKLVKSMDRIRWNRN